MADDDQEQGKEGKAAAVPLYQSPGFDLEPDPDEVLQVEDDEPTVCVVVQGPVRTQSLPRKSAGIKGVTVKDGPPTQLLRADPYRASAVIIPMGDPILIGGSEQEIQGGQPGQIPADTPVTVTARDEVWVQALGVAALTVTVIQERWAEG